MEPENWISLAGMSTGLMGVRGSGGVAASTDGGQKPSVENVFACRLPPGLLSTRASPWRLLVPDLVTMFRAGPDVHPNSGENALVRTCISWMAPRGTVAMAVWRPQPSSLLAPSRVKEV